MRTKPALSDRVLLWLSTSRRIDGLWVGSFAAEKPDLTLDRVADALALIKQLDPLRYIRLTQIGRASCRERV